MDSQSGSGMRPISPWRQGGWAFVRWVLRKVVRLFESKRARARRELEERLIREPDHLSALRQLASLYEPRERAQAIAALVRAMEAHAARGLAAHSLALAQHLARLDPEHPRAHFFLAEDAVRRGMFDEAFAAYDRAIAEHRRRGEEAEAASVEVRIIAVKEFYTHSIRARSA